MAGLVDYDCEGTISISGVAMNRPAWTIQGDDNGNGSLSQFLTLAEQRGEDRPLPGATGVIAYRRRVTVTKFTLRLVVAGEVDQSGAVAVDHTAQLFTNLNYIYTNIVAPPGTGDGTRAVVLALPGSLDATGSMHVTRLEPIRQSLGYGALWEGNLFVSIPAGKFTFA